MAKQQAKNVAADFEKGRSNYIATINSSVTGRKARFDLIPKDVYIQNTGQFVGEFVATELWEMFHCFVDIGFGAAGEPEALGNTREVAVLSSG
jgi:hypothetical protein